MQSHRQLLRVLFQLLGVYFLVDGSINALGQAIWFVRYMVPGGASLRELIETASGTAMIIAEIVGGYYLMYSGRYFLDRLAPLATVKCIECGYNLAGNTSGRCPECGVQIEPSVAFVAADLIGDSTNPAHTSEHEAQATGAAPGFRASALIPAVILIVLGIVLTLGFVRKILDGSL
ncbi:MAG: hypothetical protein AMXMBFR20_32530 [Planctomycetia bacterium]